MAKAVPSDDPRKRPLDKGRPDAARKETGKASPGDGIVQRAQDRRREVENLLAHREWTAAVPLLQSLAKLPHDSTRETALWARQQLQRIQRRNESEAPAPDKASDQEIDRDSATTTSPEAGEGAETAAEEDGLWDRLGGTRGIVVLSAVAVGLFWLSLGLVAMLSQQPVARVNIDVAESARGKQIGLGIGRRHYAVDALTGAIDVPPGLYDVSLTVDRVEVAALKVQVDESASPRLRVVMEQDQPRLQLTDEQGGVLSETALPPKPAPVVRPESPAPSAVSKVDSDTSKLGTNTKVADPGTKIEPAKPEVPAASPNAAPANPSENLPADDASPAEVARWLFKRVPIALNLNIKAGSGQNAFRYVQNASQLPSESFELDSVGLPDTAKLTSAEMAVIARQSGLRLLNLMGPGWTGDELGAFHGHKTLEYVNLYGGPPVAVSELPVCRIFPHLAKLPALRSVNIDGRGVTDSDIESLVGKTQLSTLSIAADLLTPKGVAALGELQTLRQLTLRCIDPTSSGLQDGDLQFLKSLSLLGQLNLWRCRELTGTGFQSVPQLPELRFVTFQECPKFGDEGLKALCTSASNLSNLQIASYSYGPPVPGGMTSEITNKGLAGLRPLKQLSGFTLHSARGVTDEGMSAFLALPSLRHLDLTACGVTDAGMSQLAKHKGVIGLVLPRTQVGDAGCTELAKMSQLSTLTLDQTEVSDEGIQQLAALKMLRRLSLNQTNTSAEAVAELRKALPMAEIIRP